MEFKDDVILTKYKEVGDNVEIEHAQEVSGILADNYYARQNSDVNWAANKDMKHVARIPLTTYFKLKRMGIAPDQDPKAFFNWLKIEEAEKYRRTTKTI